MKFLIQRIFACTDDNNSGLIIIFKKDGEARCIRNFRQGGFPFENWKYPVLFTDEPSYIELDEDAFKHSSGSQIKVYLQEVEFLKHNDEVKEILI